MPKLDAGCFYQEVLNCPVTNLLTAQHRVSETFRQELVPYDFRLVGLHTISIISFFPLVMVHARR